MFHVLEHLEIVIISRQARSWADLVLYRSAIDK